jgi:hypothetical protein
MVYLIIVIDEHTEGNPVRYEEIIWANGSYFKTKEFLRDKISKNKKIILQKNEGDFCDVQVDTYEMIYIDNSNSMSSTSKQVPREIIERHHFDWIGSRYKVKKRKSHKPREENQSSPIYCLECSSIYAPDKYYIFFHDEAATMKKLKKWKSSGKFEYVEKVQISADLFVS